MKTLISISGLLLCAAASIAQPDEVESIDDWVNDVSRMIEDENLVERYLSYTHSTIPGIGMPSNHITGYFDQLEIEEECEVWLKEIPLLIENSYSYAGYGAMECYYYTREGEFVCCISTFYDGFEIGRDYIDVFYFDGEEAILYINGSGETFGTMNEETARSAQIRSGQAERLLGLFMDLRVPAPCIFWEHCGDF